MASPDRLVRLARGARSGIPSHPVSFPFRSRPTSHNPLTALCHITVLRFPDGERLGRRILREVIRDLSEPRLFRHRPCRIADTPVASRLVLDRRWFAVWKGTDLFRR